MSVSNSDAPTASARSFVNDPLFPIVTNASPFPAKGEGVAVGVTVIVGVGVTVTVGVAVIVAVGDGMHA